jgi:hypothetical protein
MSEPAWLGSVLRAARERARRRAGELRGRHPTESPRELGERLVRSSATRAGLAGAATGTLALVAFPLGLPAGVAAALFVEAELLLALLVLHGLDEEGERGDLRLYALWAGAGLADAAKSAGLRAGAGALARVLRGSLPARIIARLNPALVRAILRRLGLGWVRRAARLWPLLGAPVAFVLDRSAVRALGSAALDALDSSADRRTRHTRRARKRRSARSGNRATRRNPRAPSGFGPVKK